MDVHPAPASQRIREKIGRSSVRELRAAKLRTSRQLREVSSQTNQERQKKPQLESKSRPPPPERSRQTRMTRSTPTKRGAALGCDLRRNACRLRDSIGAAGWMDSASQQKRLQTRYQAREAASPGANNGTAALRCLRCSKCTPHRQNSARPERPASPFVQKMRQKSAPPRQPRKVLRSPSLVSLNDAGSRILAVEQTSSHGCKVIAICLVKTAAAWEWARSNTNVGGAHVGFCPGLSRLYRSFARDCSTILVVP